MFEHHLFGHISINCIPKWIEVIQLYSKWIEVYEESCNSVTWSDQILARRIVIFEAVPKKSCLLYRNNCQNQSVE